MRSLSAPVLAALAAPQLWMAQLIYLDFPGSPVALATTNFDLEFEGVTYRGAAGLGDISPIDDSPGEVKGLQFTLSGVPVEFLGLALSESSIVQGTPVTIRLAIMAAAGQVLDAPVDWAGRLDTMSIDENGETCTIAATAESSAVDLLKGNALTYSDVDQQSLYPGDLAFQYVVSQNGKPIVWAGKQWLIALNGR